jgi:hypothetical protein
VAAAGRELAFPVVVSPEDLPWVVPVDPAAVDVPEPGAADGVMVAAVLAAEVGVAPGAAVAAGLAVVVAAAAEAHPGAVAGADATVVSQSAG